MQEFTLIVCSYGTPYVLLSMLRSYVKYNLEFLPQKVLIMENSRDEETANLLSSYGIPFERNPGDTHSISVDKALQLCQSKYALLVDSDVLFNKNIKEVFEYMKTSGSSLLGELVKSRGGYKLKNRIGPWLCFIDVEEIKKNNIRFHDQKKIDESGSQGFFNNVPLQQNTGNVLYDVGSSFLEDIVDKGMKVSAISEETRKQFAAHFEGMSWRSSTGIQGYIEWANKVEKEFFKMSKELDGIDIRNQFKG